MKLNWKIKVLLFAYSLMLLVMFILPLKSDSDYSMIRNTLSELGGQCMPDGWIINMVLALLSSASLVNGWSFFKDYTLHRILLTLFAVTLMLAAYFNHAPAGAAAQYNLIEDGLHTYFLGTAGLTFVILSLVSSFNLEKQYERRLALLTGLSIIFLSFMTAELNQFAGIWQRLQFLISFGWLIFIFRSGEL